MAHEPKVEIYKIRLRNKEDGGSARLRELLRKKFNEYPKKEYPKLNWPLQPADILNTMYADLINKIDGEGFNKNEHKKKGFTVASKQVGKGRKAEIISNTDTSVVHGIIVGGKYGLKRTLSEIDHKDQGTSIETNHVVGDRFYFLMYTPIDESTLVVMVQGYTETRIADVFMKFLHGYFKYGRTYSCEVEHFIPKSLKEKYINGATFKSMSFTSDWKIQANFDDDFEEREYDLEVKIVITDKSQDKAKHSSYLNYFKEIAKSKFKLVHTNERVLEDFGTRRAKMESRGKEFPINFDDENDIRPTILLSNEGIRVDEGLMPNFEDIDQYCKKLLVEIIEDINPRNAVDRI